MKNSILLEVAARWEAEAAESTNNKKWTEAERAREIGHREGLRRCADTLRTLVAELTEPIPINDPLPTSLDLVVAELLAGMSESERLMFRSPEQWHLKSTMRACGMQRLPDPIAGGDLHGCNGEMVCEKCGKEYRAHPMDWREIGYGNVPFMNILCSGRRVKL